MTDIQLLTVPQLAELLRVSKTSVYRLVERRQVTFIRLPRGLRFRREDIEAFMRSRSTESVGQKL